MRILSVSQEWAPSIKLDSEGSLARIGCTLAIGASIDIGDYTAREKKTEIILKGRQAAAGKHPIKMSIGGTVGSKAEGHRERRVVAKESDERVESIFSLGGQFDVGIVAKDTIAVDRLTKWQAIESGIAVDLADKVLALFGDGDDARRDIETFFLERQAALVARSKKETKTPPTIGESIGNEHIIVEDRDDDIDEGETRSIGNDALKGDSLGERGAEGDTCAMAFGRKPVAAPFNRIDKHILVALATVDRPRETLDFGTADRTHSDRVASRERRDKTCGIDKPTAIGRRSVEGSKEKVVAEDEGCHLVARGIDIAAHIDRFRPFLAVEKRAPKVHTAESLTLVAGEDHDFAIGGESRMMDDITELVEADAIGLRLSSLTRYLFIKETTLTRLVGSEEQMSVGGITGSVADVAVDLHEMGIGDKSDQLPGGAFSPKHKALRLTIDLPIDQEDVRRTTGESGHILEDSFHIAILSKIHIGKKSHGSHESDRFEETHKEKR